MKASTIETLPRVSQNFLPAFPYGCFASFLQAEGEHGKLSNFGDIENITLKNSSAPLLRKSRLPSGENRSLSERKSARAPLGRRGFCSSNSCHRFTKQPCERAWYCSAVGFARRGFCASRPSTKRPRHPPSSTCSSTSSARRSRTDGSSGTAPVPVSCCSDCSV